MAVFKYMLQLQKKMYEASFKSPFMWRSLSIGKCVLKNYEGDGKTTVTILNREHKHLILIDSYSNFGFRLNNGIFAVGPLAVFPRTILQWNISTGTEITPESLSLFCLLEPRLDLLLIGTGDKKELLSAEVRNYLKTKKINTEVLATEHAVATFNFLNVEHRCVAGAFIPPTNVSVYDDEIPLVHTYDADCVEQVPLPKIEK